MTSLDTVLNSTIVRVYESPPTYDDGLYSKDTNYTLVITKGSDGTYTYTSQLDNYVEYVNSKVLVKLTDDIYDETLTYLPLIKVLAKKLEPHLDGDDTAQKVVIKTGTLGYNTILRLVKACLYEFNGRTYTYDDVKGFINYCE